MKMKPVLLAVAAVGLIGSAAPAAIVYQQDFSTAAAGGDGNDPAGWTDVNHSFFIDGGEYRNEQSGSTTALAFYNAGDSTWTDYTVTTQFRYAGNAYTGLVGHVQDMLNYYTVRYNSGSQHLQLIKFVGANVAWVQDSAESFNLSTGSNVLLRLAFSGNVITGQLTGNDDGSFASPKLTVSFTDTSGFINSGGVGFRSSANPGAISVFDNLTVDAAAPVPTPEPAALGLAGLGMAALILRRR